MTCFQSVKIIIILALLKWTPTILSFSAQEEEGPCEDKTWFRYKNKKNQNCKWVKSSDTTKRCNKKWKGVVIKNKWCPFSCGNCNNVQKGGPPYLKDVVPNGFHVGGPLTGYNPQWKKGEYREVAKREFNIITSTIFMGMNGLNNMGPFDDIVNFAHNNDLAVHGHTLVYPAANIDYWEEHPNANVSQTLKLFINRAAGGPKRKGRIAVWDVVNEAFGYPGQDNLDKFGLTTDYKEYQALGSDYIAKAFYWARNADPDAVLIYNDGNAEEFGDRSTKIFNFIVDQRSKGVPIDGIGFQMHVWGPDDGWENDINSVRKNFQRFENAGISIYITEMDVMSAGSETRAKLPTEAQLKRQADIYREVAELATDMSAVKSLMLWDFADDRSWMHPSYFQLGDYSEGTFFFPTPWWGGNHHRSAMVAKPAYYALRDGLTTNNSYFYFTSKWEEQSSYMYQDSTNPRKVKLSNLVEHDSSLQWSLEEVAGKNDIFRVLCRLGKDAGYLTRNKIWNKNKKKFDPLYTVSLRPRVEAKRQLWIFESSGNDSWWRVINQWHPNSGMLTRLGILNDDSSNWKPSNKVQLDARNDEWDSQYWRKIPV